MHLYLTPVLGFLSFLTPCMWNQNLILRAYVRREGPRELILLAVSRSLLFNLIASCVSVLSEHIRISPGKVLIVQAVVALVFILGFPLMRRIGVAPFDLSPQFLLPSLRLSPGLSLGLSLPYCSIPFIVLLTVYALSYGYPFVVFNLYLLSATVPTLLVVWLSEGWLKSITKVIPSVPAVTGTLLIVSLGLTLDLDEVSIFVSSLLQRDISLWLLIPVMFSLGVLTSLGPSTLPLLPVVFGIIMARKENAGVPGRVFSFLIAFVLAHSFAGGVVSAGVVTLGSLFRTDFFNLFLFLILLLVAFNLLGVTPFSFELARLSPVTDPRASGFLIGFAYTFSLCPSCSSLFLGALTLSVLKGSVTSSALLMGVYALGRSFPVFLSGLVVRYLGDTLFWRQDIINRLIGFLFLGMSLYFLRNFWEAVS